MCQMSRNKAGGHSLSRRRNALILDLSTDVSPPSGVPEAFVMNADESSFPVKVQGASMEMFEMQVKSSTQHTPQSWDVPRSVKLSVDGLVA